MAPRKTPPPAEPPSREPAPVPSKENLDHCRRCELWERATQGVPGEGPAGARLMLVGEQPGDEEDVQGRPFVGPAGRVLRELLQEAGIAAEQVFVTNAVKHFFFEPRGKRRIHKTPMQRHIAACHAWLEGELMRIRPAVIVTLPPAPVSSPTVRSIKPTKPVASASGVPTQARPP